MDAPRSAVRFSAIIVEIRALGSQFVAFFVLENYKNPITKTLFPKTPKDLLIGCWGYFAKARHAGPPEGGGHARKRNRKREQNRKQRTKERKTYGKSSN